MKEINETTHQKRMMRMIHKIHVGNQISNGNILNMSTSSTKVVQLWIDIICSS